MGEHSLSGSYDHKTKLLFDELHTVVEDLERLYKKLQATNRANYILKLRRGWGETNRDSSLYSSRRKYNWAGLVGDNKFFLYGASDTKLQGKQHASRVNLVEERGGNTQRPNEEDIVGQEEANYRNSLRRRNSPNVHPPLPRDNNGYLPD